MILLETGHLQAQTEGGGGVRNALWQEIPGNLSRCLGWCGPGPVRGAGVV